MGRAWQFFLTVAITIAVMSYFYYSSDYYAKRSTDVAPAALAAGTATSDK
jgi:hypothetical protein